MGTIRAATAAPEPPLDPPQLRSGRQGFRVAPWRGVSVIGRMPSSLVAVLPTITIPALRALDAATPSTGDQTHRSASLPYRVWERRTWSRSLIAMGTPHRGEVGVNDRARRARSSLRARRRARRSKTWVKAFRPGLWVAIRSRYSAVSSSTPIRPARICLDCSTAVSSSHSFTGSASRRPRAVRMADGRFWASDSPPRRPRIPRLARAGPRPRAKPDTTPPPTAPGGWRPPTE